MIRIVTCGLLVLSCYFAVAQGDYREGYIVKVNGDSVSGWIKYPSLNKTLSVITFRPTRKSTSRSFSSEELIAFGFSSGRRFESKEIKDKLTHKRVFMRALVKGPLSLYLSGNSIFVQKDTLFELPSPERGGYSSNVSQQSHKKNRYIGLLTVLVSDCAKMNAYKTKFTLSDIESLVKSYNACLHLASIDYPDKERLLKATGTLGLGVGFSNLSNLTEDILVNYETTVVPQFFMGVQINLPRLQNNLSFTADLFFIKEKYYGFNKEVSFTTIRSDFDVEATRLKIPLGFKYDFFLESSEIFIRTGVNFQHSIASELIVRQEEEFNGEVRSSTFNSSIPLTSRWDIWSSIGYSRSIFGKFRISGEFRYESGLFSMKPPKSHSILFLVGLHF